MLVESIGWTGTEMTDVDRHRLIRRLVGILVSDSIEAISENIKAEKIKSALDIQKLDHNVIGYSSEMKRKNRQLKDFLYNNLYRHHRVVRMAVKAERTLEEMFNAFRREPEMLARNFQGMIEKRGLERTICDYIAGMTDRYAIEEYQKLFNPLTLP